ncbi:MAG: SAM-dependent methyltransferase [Hapalosiphonaceae cyanobacterium JJU2]|nr:MAG: SAM-dependent methyltransferase [Hapalosiphonaceae cyanobacterium JJU2]
MEVTPLHTMNPLTRFSDRAEDYVKYRGSYPPSAIDAILAGLAPPQELILADIGAGPGVASQLFAQRGVRVLAIEPNAAMRKAAIPHPLIEFRDATAESTNLPDASVDVVTCCSAFQWFNHEVSLLEFRRILKASGRLAVLANDRLKNDQFTGEYVRLLRASSENAPPEACFSSVEPLINSPHFVNIRQYTFDHRREVDLTGLIGNAMSYSTVPRQGLAHQQLISSLQDLHERHCNEHGMVSLIYRTIVHLAEPVSE